MSFIEFSELFLTEIKEIDFQHKKIVNFINVIYEAKRLRINNKTLEDSLESLINYINYHMNYEEEFLQNHNYPYLEEHKTEHQKIKNQLNEFLNQDNENRDLNKFLKFVKSWFLNHVLIFDKKYSKYLLHK